MAKLEFFCLVCGSPWDGDLAGQCPGCSGGWRTMEAAGGLLAEAGRGYHIALRRFARDPEFQHLRILDVTSDPVIERELNHLSGYRKIVARDQGARHNWLDWLIPINTAVPQRLPLRDGIIDALVVRDVIRIVPDMELFIAECFRVLAPGGSLVLQDRYQWPLPDHTTAVAAAAGSDGDEHTGSPAAAVRQIGASLLDDLKKAGFAAHFERPAMSLDLLYRGGFAVATKPGGADAVR